MLKKNFWQKKLQSLSISIKNRKDFTYNSYNIEAQLEFNVMSGFFIIRKLIEHNRLTNKFIATNIKGSRFQFLTGKKITPFNDHKWPDFYDFVNKRGAKFNIPFLCNLFIHNFYFIPSEVFVEESINENFKELSEEEYSALCKIHKRKHQAILVNSDDTKQKYLFEIDIDKIAKIFEEVSLMDITKTSIKYNPKMGKYEYLQSDEDLEMSDELKKMIEKNQS